MRSRTRTWWCPSGRFAAPPGSARRGVEPDASRDPTAEEGGDPRVGPRPRAVGRHGHGLGDRSVARAARAPRIGGLADLPEPADERSGAARPTSPGRGRNPDCPSKAAPPTQTKTIVPFTSVAEALGSNRSTPGFGPDAVTCRWRAAVRPRVTAAQNAFGVAWRRSPGESPMRGGGDTTGEGATPDAPGLEAVAGPATTRRRVRRSVSPRMRPRSRRRGARSRPRANGSGSSRRSATPVDRSRVHALDSPPHRRRPARRTSGARANRGARMVAQARPRLPDVHRRRARSRPPAGRGWRYTARRPGALVGRVPAGTEADVDRAVAAARAAFRDGRWSRRYLPGASGDPGAACRPDRGARRRARAPRDAPDRLRVQASPRLGPAVHGGQPALLRGRGPAPGGKGRLRVLGQPHQLRPPRAAGRGGPGQPLELPALDGDLEDRPGARRGQLRRPQARLGHAPDHDPARRAGRGGRAARRRAERDHGPRRRRGRGARRPPGRGPRSRSRATRRPGAGSRRSPRATSSGRTWSWAGRRR